jgi:hypothetical protein
MELWMTVTAPQTSRKLGHLAPKVFLSRLENFFLVVEGGKLSLDGPELGVRGIRGPLRVLYFGVSRGGGDEKGHRMSCCAACVLGALLSVVSG